MMQPLNAPSGATTLPQSVDMPPGEMPLRAPANLKVLTPDPAQMKVWRDSGNRACGEVPAEQGSGLQPQSETGLGEAVEVQQKPGDLFRHNPDQSHSYRGRIAPSPTGYLHLGHARTFLIAAERVTSAGGTLVFRNEDLDGERCRQEFVTAMVQDLRWLGIDWSEGPDCGGDYGPYSQSERQAYYLEAWRELRQLGLIYPCSCSRRDLALAASAPDDSDDEPIYPGTCRNKTAMPFTTPSGVNWRFRIPQGETITFCDRHQGDQQYIAGSDFGDFLIWRKDGVPAYQLAVVVDDHAMRISEVVRGRDLLKSTARQLLLYRALRFPSPRFYHCDLVCDERGVRLAKRHDALSLRKLREAGLTQEEVRVRALKGGRCQENCSPAGAIET